MHEFVFNLARLQSHLEILGFLARSPWLFPNTLTLTSSLFLCLLGYSWPFFFCDLIPTSVTRYTLLFYLPNFLFCGQIAHTTLRLVASGCAATISRYLCFGIIQMTIPRFSSGFGLYISLYFLLFDKLLKRAFTHTKYCCCCSDRQLLLAYVRLLFFFANLRNMLSWYIIF